MKKSNLLVLSFLFCIIALSPAQKAKKNFTVTGIVRDATMKPIQGATMFIDNVKTESVTDAKGVYRVRVSASAKEIMAFTFFGTAEQQINGRTSIDFILGDKSEDKPGQQKSSDNTVTDNQGGMPSSGALDVRDTKFAAAQTIYDMIRGRFSGVDVSGNKITIRGERSLNVSSDPLFVVDGIIVNSIDGISPQNVKTIEVLKGPAASVYGTRGSNGVIVITQMTGKDRK